MAEKLWAFLVQVLWYLPALAVPENNFSGCVPCPGARITNSVLGLWAYAGITEPARGLCSRTGIAGPGLVLRGCPGINPFRLASGVAVIGRVRSDYSNRVHHMADRNYGGNGGRVLTMAALAAAQ
jgi:hypothetical protein